MGFVDSVCSSDDVTVADCVCQTMSLCQTVLVVNSPCLSVDVTVADCVCQTMSLWWTVFVGDSGVLPASVWRSGTDRRPSTASGESGPGGRRVHARAARVSRTPNVTATIRRELVLISVFHCCVLLAVRLLDCFGSKSQARNMVFFLSMKDTVYSCLSGGYCRPALVLSRVDIVGLLLSSLGWIL